MRRTENRNAPNLWGWAIAAGVGLAAFGVLLVVGRFDFFPAVAMAGVIALVVGLILGMPSRELPGPVKPPVAKVPEATVVKAPEARHPVAESVAAGSVVAPALAGPVRLGAPRGDKADDLKEIEGIGPALEKLVNQLGIYHFDQIAAWTEADVAAIDAQMKTFRGRIARDRWVAQARIIVAEGLPAFRERVKTGNY